jgi:DNA polymerase-3 subunit beta
VLSDDLEWGCRQATVTTSEESRGVDFTFAQGSSALRLHSQASDVGSSDTDVPLRDYQGDGVTFALDPRYIADAVKAVGAGYEFEFLARSPKEAVYLTGEDGYEYVMMVLTRDR